MTMTIPPTQHQHNQSESSALLPKQLQQPIHLLTPLRQHNPLYAFILSHAHSQPGLLSSAALNENDLSPAPIGLDLPNDTDLPSFRTQNLAILDIFKAIILCLQTVETAIRFLGPPPRLPDPSWHQHIYFPLPSSQYTTRLITLICPPALHFLLGCATVMAIHTRRCLGWNSSEIFWRSVRRGGSLMVLNQLLVCQTLFKTHARVLLVMLPIWSFGWNLIFITALLVTLFQAEHALLKYFHSKLPCALDPPDQSVQMKTWAGQLALLIDLSLVSCAGIAPLVIAYMLPGDRRAPDQDWWIDYAQTRSRWFWFFIAPTPDMEFNPRFRMISTFAPIGWLPFVMLGAFYGRVLIRKRRTRAVLCFYNLILAIYAFLIFGFTRVFDFGNLTEPTPLPPRAFRWLRGSWQMAVYTTSCPPDLAHLALTSMLIFLALALLGLTPQTLLNFNPLIQFGRAPIFFYSIQLLSFHYVLPVVLGILDWPSRLSLAWTIAVSVSCLLVFWLACEAWVICKDRKAPESLWRFF